MKEPLRVVSIGGGTGLSSILNGLKHYAHPQAGKRWVDITAVVTVTDDGGSSGRLRREFDVLPPGDIRNCMVALSEDGAFLSRLFQYRFQSGRGLKGHSFGNLFLTALTEITGDFGDAVRQSAEVLKIAGKIYPATDSNVVLEAILDDGRVVRGETRISRSRVRIRKVRLEPRGAKPLGNTLDAIARADVITLGPGSLFTSVIPNLLVAGIPKAIRQSKALKAYFVNLMTQPGETSDFSAADHLKAIRSHAGPGLVDYAVVNTGIIPATLRRRYAAGMSAPIEYDREAILAQKVKVIEAVLLEHGAEHGVKVRHNPAALANVVLDLAQQGRAARKKSR